MDMMGCMGVEIRGSRSLKHLFIILFIYFAFFFTIIFTLNCCDYLLLIVI